MNLSRRGLLESLLAVAVLPRPAIIRTPGLLMPIRPMVLKATLPCDGKPVAIKDYPELFGLIGYDYGTGPTKEEFRIPALVDRLIYTGVNGAADTLGFLASPGGVLLSEPIVERYWRDAGSKVGSMRTYYAPIPLGVELALEQEEAEADARWYALQREIAEHGVEFVEDDVDEDASDGDDEADDV